MAKSKTTHPEGGVEKFLVLPIIVLILAQMGTSGDNGALGLANQQLVDVLGATTPDIQLANMVYSLMAGAFMVAGGLVGTIIGMLVQGALLAAGILMPIYVQSLHGLSATVSGLVLMPGAILMGIMNPLAGKWFDRHGPRRMAIVGMSLLTLTTFAFAILNLTSSIIYITIVYTVRMFSMSLVNMPITTWGMNALDNKVMNHGTSVNNTLRQVVMGMFTSDIENMRTVYTMVM